VYESKYITEGLGYISQLFMPEFLLFEHAKRNCGAPDVIILLQQLYILAPVVVSGNPVSA
jgi:hypothetical protein